MDPKQIKERLRQALEFLQCNAYMAAENVFRSLDEAQLTDARIRAVVQRGLATVLLRGGQPEEAREIFSRLIQSPPRDLSLVVLHGNALAAMGRLDEATGEFARVVRVDPANCPAIWGLAKSLFHSGKPQLSLGHYAKLVQLDPDTATNWFEYGMVFLKMGSFEDARMAMEKYLELEPDDPLGAGVHLSRISGNSNLNALPPEFVKTHFDAFSLGFENQLVNILRYRGHELLAEAVAQCQVPRPIPTILDLGCGTGLCAQLFQNPSTAIDGIDLSGRMITIASMGDVYRNLFQGDVVAVMREQLSVPYDLALAGEIFVYIADPAEVLESLHPLLVEGGLFAFTIETLLEASSLGYQLCDTLRYRHALPYIRDRAVKAGFTVKIENPCTLRTEDWKAVQGAVFVVEKIS
jgi:predicted TPR repeat methyltransferase